MSHSNFETIDVRSTYTNSYVGRIEYNEDILPGEGDVIIIGGVAYSVDRGGEYHYAARSSDDVQVLVGLTLKVSRRDGFE